MKKFTFFAAIAMIAFTTNAVAQSSATTTAASSATVITPIAIAKTIDLNFGNLVATTSGGTVTVAPDGTRTGHAATIAGNQNGTISAAEFTVTGETDFTYAITLPASPFVVAHTDLTEMSVGTFVSTPSTTGVLALGTQTLKVGATITLIGGETSGAYTNASDLAVTVYYN